MKKEEEELWNEYIRLVDEMKSLADRRQIIRLKIQKIKQKLFIKFRSLK
jgi:hypothetical protein